jgi:hypothetical protein
MPRAGASGDLGRNPSGVEQDARAVARVEAAATRRDAAFWRLEAWRTIERPAALRMFTTNPTPRRALRRSRLLLLPQGRLTPNVMFGDLIWPFVVDSAAVVPEPRTWRSEADQRRTGGPAPVK